MIMNPRVKEVVVLENYHLLLIFKNQERKIFDMNPYLSIGIFKRLQNPAFFSGARVNHGTVVWSEEIDFDPDILWLESKACLDS
jgi:hypothetical protein